MKALLTVVYLLLGLVALLTSVCGGLVAIEALLNFSRDGSLLGVALPSLVVGALLFRFAQRRSRALNDPYDRHE